VFTTNLIYNVFINLFCIAILIVLCFDSLKNYEKNSLQYKIYMMVLYSTIFMLVLDMFSRFDGRPGTIYPVINHIGNFFVFLLNPVLPSLWLLYVYFQIFKEVKIKRLVYLLLVVNLANAVMVVFSQFYGWYYYIDSENIYHRGRFYLVTVSITIALMFAAYVLIIFNRKRIEKKYYSSLLLFGIPPSICIALHIIFYGISILLAGIVLSILIVYLNIQNESIYTDYLTRINNRKSLDIYLRGKINSCTGTKSFSAILLDLNNFKLINDTLGHDVGDDALQTSAKLLASCIRANDFIARYGGDEFYIIIDDTDRIDPEIIVTRINQCVEKYNDSGLKPYKLGFSMGCARYDVHSNMKAEDFQKHIDKLMYENKRAARIPN